ncbi:hypothetical protein [Salipaludibacillus sp. CF4.18]|uniref:hypothetical protein n=1 Tax=Salipaludibacillus sp. CF4.18 TaxID=3373081 RepID=UPI003EE73846
MITTLIGAGINGAVLLILVFLNRSKEIKLEQLKNDLSMEKEILNQKRELYSQFAKYLNVFVNDRYVGDELKMNKKKLLESYDHLWLWANEELLKNISLFFDTLVKKENGQFISDDEIKSLHREIIISLRKDLGVKTVSIDKEDYKFISFR